MFCRIQEHDESYYPPTCEAELRERPGIAEERKFIVFESQLMVLFKQCHICGLDMELETSIRGTLLAVTCTCPDGHVLDWQSQPTVKGMAAGNLLLSTAILLCGLTFTGVANSADVFNLAMFGERYFYRLQNSVVLVRACNFSFSFSNLAQ